MRKVADGVARAADGERSAIVNANAVGLRHLACVHQRATRHSAPAKGLVVPAVVEVGGRHGVIAGRFIARGVHALAVRCGLRQVVAERRRVEGCVNGLRHKAPTGTTEAATGSDRQAIGLLAKFSYKKLRIARILKIERKKSSIYYKRQVLAVKQTKQMTGV